MFAKLYQRVLDWSRHRHAVWYLAGLSFAESSFFPIPPDFILVPMAMAHPKRSWWYASLTLVTSVLGGLFGYWLGYCFIQVLHPWIIELGYGAVYDRAVHWFAVWGFWAIVIAGCGPIPYKIFTIAAGALGLPLLPFTLGSIIGRGSRFYLIAWLMFFWGAKFEKVLMRYLDRIMYGFLLLLGVALIIGWYIHVKA